MTSILHPGVLLILLGILVGLLTLLLTEGMPSLTDLGGTLALISVFTEKSLEETKEVVRRKLQLSPNSNIKLIVMHKFSSEPWFEPDFS